MKRISLLSLLIMFSLTSISNVLLATSPVDCAAKIVPMSNELYYIDSDVKALDFKVNTLESGNFDLFTHGQEGKLLIEGHWLDSEGIAAWLEQSHLLKGVEHLNIYGCNFAKGEKGKQAVSYLETALGISIAASDDITGIDGDWELEVGQDRDAISVPDYRYNLQCNCTEYIYLNETTDGGKVHKLAVAADGTLTEVIVNGDAWYPAGGTSQLSSPHGLGSDLNGFLYIGETAFGATRRLTCDGEIIPASEFSIDDGGFNFASVGNSLFVNRPGTPLGLRGLIREYDLCTGDLIGQACLDNINAVDDWGFYYDENTGYFYSTDVMGAGSVNIHSVFKYTIDDFQDPATFDPTMCVAPLITGHNFDNFINGDPLDPVVSTVNVGDNELPDGDLRGITTDPAGNIYIVQQENDSGIGNPLRSGRLLKYDANGNFIAATPWDITDSTTDLDGLFFPLGIVYSETSGTLFISRGDPLSNCVQEYSTDLVDLGVAVPPSSSSSVVKGIAIQNECCPSPAIQTVSQTICMGSEISASVFLNELFPCDGVICEAMWTPVDAASTAIYESCSQSITTTMAGCYSFVKESDGTSAASQCGAFNITFNLILIDVPDVTITGSSTVCEGGTTTLTATGFTDNSALQWQMSSTSCDGPWVNIAGANGTTYDPTNVTATTYYRLFVTETGDGCPSDECTGVGACFTLTPNGGCCMIVCDSVDGTDVSCNGGSDGTATVNYSGALGNISFVWSNGATTQTVSGLTAGTYMVTVTDDTSADCSATCSVTIADPTPLSCSLSGVDPLCAGMNSGSITVSGSGGTGIYEYSLNGGPYQPGATFTNLVAGNYTVQIRDANLCLETCVVTLTDPPALSCSVVATDETDCNAEDGTITITAAGGTAAAGTYSYSIDGMTYGSTAVFTNLIAGNYTLYVQDDNGCISTCMGMINAPSAPMCMISNVVNVTCNGGSTGSFDVTGSGGSGSYEFSLDGFATAANTTGVFTGLSMGNYLVTVRNVGQMDCISTCNVMITEPPAISCNTMVVNVLCNGETTGTIQAMGVGGSGTYEYSIDGFATAANTFGVFSGLGANTYTVTVRDVLDNSCTSTCAAEITEPQPLSCTLSKTDVDCSLNMLGSITVSALDGQPSYEYSLNGAAFQPGSSYSDLDAGDYTVTVRDANGCETSCLITIEEVNCIFDLALEKTLSTSGPVSPGDAISFNIEVCNQGTVDAYNVEIDDYYIPTELVLADATWSDASTSGVASINNDIDFIATGECQNVTITFTVHADFMGDMLINYAEITSADDDDDPSNTFPTDADSTPGDNQGDDELANDGETVDTETGDLQDDDADSDDYDPAPVPITQVFDLALVKTYSGFADANSNGVLDAGEDATFTITVYNQGTVDATGVVVTDYVPSDMIYTQAGANATAGWDASPNPTNTLGNLAAGASASVDIVLTVDPMFMGMSLYNNAEITSGTNALGLIDEDDPIGNVTGASDDTSENPTDNDIDDDGAGTPGTADNPNDIDDYDIAEVTIGQIFDLAINKVIDATATPGPYFPGDAVSFTVTVFNQGTVDATDIVVEDYIPSGMLFMSSPDFSLVGAEYLANIASLPAGGMQTLSITLQIDPSFMGMSAVNNVEIVGGENALGLTDQDDDLANEDGSSDDVSELDTDNDYDDEGAGTPGTSDNPLDVDDYDPAEVPVEQIFDLALEKTLSTSGPVSPGDAISFNIEVCNQGTVDAYNVEIDDYYIPTELVLADATWSDASASGVASINNDIDFIATGECQSVTITFTVHADFMGDMLINYAEITSADDDDDPSNTFPTDADSTPGDNQGDDELANDGETVDTETGDLQDDDPDSDDYDPAPVPITQVFDLALVKTYSGFADANSNGVLDAGEDATFTITVYNQGTVDATGVVVTDYVPSDMIYTQAGANATAGWDASPNPTNTLGNLAAGASASVDIVLTVDPSFMGMSLYNNAEITSGTNALGLIDEDDPIGNVTGASDDTSENPTDNDIDDDGAGTPGTADNPNDIDDYDIAEVTIGQIFDLAINKVIDATATPGPYFPGDAVSFTVTVFNQGTVDATDIVVEDYIPSGMLFMSSPDFSLVGAEYLANIASLPAGGMQTLSITLQIDPSFMGMSAVNNVEIVGGENALGLTDQDDDLANEDGSSDDVSELDTDNDYDDEGAGTPGTSDNPLDVDDYDPAEVPVEQIFDLALEKTLSTSGPVSPGDAISFNIEVCNQGTVDAYNVEIDDYYIPTELVLADATWSDASASGVASINNDIPFIGVGECQSVTITFTVHADFMGDMLINYAEITSADDDDDPSNTFPTDADSTPGDNQGDDELANDGETVDTETGDLQDDDPDSDDYDPAPVPITQVFDLALVKTYSGFADANSNGVLDAGEDATFTITVYNQGTVDATGVVITDYVPSDMIYTQAGANATAGWDASPNPTNTLGNLAAGASASVDIVLTVDPMFMGTVLYNNAEITSGTNALGLIDEDDPIGNVTGASDDTSENPTDNDIDDDGAGTPGTADNPNDIDDYDIAEVTIGQIFDLAINKVIDATATPGPYFPGDAVSFTVTVFNQGTVDATDIVVEDYIPSGMLFMSSPDFSLVGAEYLANIASLPAGGMQTLSITLQIDPSFMGMSAVNNVEIVGGENALGLTDQDDDLANEDGSSDDVSELDTDNDYDDEGAGTPGTSDNPLDVDDYDPAEVPVEQIFDLALEKTLSTSGPVSPGDAISFNIEVCNQGTVDAYNVEIDDYYIPTELVLADATWSDASASGVASINNDIDFIATGECQSVTITFTVHADFMGDMLINYAEITSADDDDDPSNTFPTDADSTPGDNQGDDELANDGETVDTETGDLQDDDPDSDDYDPAPVPITQVFDLALDKVFLSHADANGNGAINPGENVTFEVTVYNQGNLDATNVVVTDYLPSGMSFVSSPDFSLNSGSYTATIANLASASFETLELTLMVDPTFMGTVLTNNAEITDATNALGIDDEDDPLSNVTGSSDDTSELLTDNDTDDDFPGTPGTADNPSDIDDYDLAQITVAPVFDLALDKVIDPSGNPGPYSPGDQVTYLVTVYNQGNVDATGIVVEDYLPTGMNFVSSPDFSLMGTQYLATIASLPAGGMQTLSITLEIDANFMGTSMVNNAEIIGGTNALGIDDEDDPLGNIDGSSDDGGELDTNDDTDDDGTGTPGTADNVNDVDDYDPEEIAVVQIFDLALEKLLTSPVTGPYSPGDIITFTLEVTNQGTLDAYNIDLEDYYDPSELILMDANWTDIGATGVATLNNDILFIGSGEMESVTITFQIDPSFMGSSLVNYGEITSADDDNDPSNTPPMDADSTPGDNQGDDELANDGEIVDTETGDLQDDDPDSDDYDPAPVLITQVFDLALDKTFGSFVDTDMDGFISQGEQVTFEVTVYNQGNLDATNVVVTDYIPSDMSFVSSPNFSLSGGQYTATIASLPMGGSASLEITLMVDPMFMGMYITNNAEITAATNALGIDDEDDPLSNVTGSSDDTSELPTDNDTDDDFMGTPGSTDNPDDIDDYDPEMIMVGQVFDLALTKAYDSYSDTNGDGVLSPGDDVQFLITVYNQGTMDAYNIQVTDYIPTGLTLSDGSWNNISNPNEAQLNSVIGFLGAMSSTTLTINFTTDLYWRGDKITNWAEISAADNDNDPTNGFPDDIDSEPNSDITDDNFGGDDEIFNNNNDEDDHDPAEIVPVVELDLALAKKDPNNDPVGAWGEIRTFDIEVTNQGTIVATEFTVVDYIPCGMEFVSTPGTNPGWTYDSSTRIAEFIYDETIIVPNQTITLTIDLEMVPCTGAASTFNHVNYSEISDYDDDFDDFNPDIPDVDSDPDATNFDDPGGEPEGPSDDYIDGDGSGPFGNGPAATDEDDHDPEKVEVFDLALIKTLETPGPYNYGQLLEFKITVCNQGNEGATNTVIEDYYPAGYTFDFADNIGWAGTVANPTYTIVSEISPEQCTDVKVFLRIQQTTGGEKDWFNYAEIISTQNEDGDDRTNWDVDSTPGTDNADENGVEPDDAQDDDMASMDKGEEEDDHDPAGIEIFDLAQIKTTLDNGPWIYGDDILYTITVYNQGSIEASSIEITDNLPCGFAYISSNDANGWSYDASTHMVVTTLPGTLAPGASTTIDILVKVQQCIDLVETSFTNYTEISGAESEDPNEDPNDIDSNSDDNEFNDGTPIDNAYEDPSDEDDHDPERIEVFDLALKKEVVTAGPYAYGDLLEFKITVCNQGNVNGANIEVTDYIPDGYSFDLANNPGWSGAYPSPTYAIPGVLAQDACTEFSIYLTIVSTDGDYRDWINYAEVTGATDENGGPVTDADSVPGSNGSGENDVEPGDAADDDMTSTEMGGDEDDHDPAGIDIYDLAQIKYDTGSGSYRYGDLVTFNIDVTNQGNLDATYELTDYIPCGFIYQSSNDANGWSYDASTGNATLVVNSTLVPGATVSHAITLELTACADMSPTGFTNIGEISNDDGDDIDSVPDTDPNDPGGEPGSANDDEDDEDPGLPGEDDEDDNDPALVEIFDLALRKSVDFEGPYAPGETVEYKIEVFNQGNVDAYNTVISDYVNTGYIFNAVDNPTWAMTGGIAETNIPFLEAGERIELLLYLEVTVPAGADQTVWINEAEVSSSDNDDDPTNDPPVDVDSDMDDNPDNDNDVQPGDPEDNEIYGHAIPDGEDEDDNDVAQVIVVGDLCGRIWNDCNGDGIRNDGPSNGMAGVQVDIYTEDGTYVGSEVTDALGFYERKNLIPQNYYIKVNKPDGFSATDFRQGIVLSEDSDLDDSNGDCTSPSAYLQPGSCKPGSFDAGLYECIPIGELVWYDINENDVKDAFENGINGLPIELWQLKNGVWSLYETQFTGHKPGTPSDDGYFKFCAPPGTYEIRVDLPSSGLVPTVKNVGTNGGLDLTDANESTTDSDVNFNQTTGSFTVNCNTGDVCNIGAGYYPMAQVGNRVWYDANNDGLQSASENGVAGVQVKAYNSNDEMVSESVTDSNGEYMVQYLGKDEYYLKFTPPSGYGMTIPNAGGNDAMDSDVDGSNGPGTTDVISLNPGDDLPEVDAGLVFGVVPVEWLSFEGFHRGNYNDLEWSTASEINASHFEVERSLQNTLDFVEIGKVVASGNSSEVQKYEMRDYDVEETGIYYYRLKQVDYNGNYSYSNTISIRIEGTGKDKIDLYPNPAVDEFTIDVNVLQQSEVQVSIWDATGKLIINNVVNEVLEAGTYQKAVDIKTLPAGMYNVKVTIENTVYNKKLLKVD